MGIGALVAAGLAEPVENLEAHHRGIQTAVGDVDLPAMLQAAVMDIAREHRDGRIEPLSTTGPLTPDERPSYGHLAGHGIDTVPEIGVDKLRLTSCPGPCRRMVESNPPFALEATGTARLIRTAAGPAIAASALAATDGPNEFAAWAKDDAAAIREGSRRLARALAEAAAVFLGLPALEATPAEHAGHPDGDPRHVEEDLP
jgi:hypothetical protein